jgi:hypothetical protein
MANIPLTPISFFRGAWLCLLLLFRPARFLEEQGKVNEANCEALSVGGRVEAVRRAFLESLVLVVLSALAGYGTGVLLSMASCATPRIITGLQLAGACVLCWGTLFVRGSEIESWFPTLTERVNQWLYRTLYCVGTGIVVLSLAWTTCR